MQVLQAGVTTEELQRFMSKGLDPSGGVGVSAKQGDPEARRLLQETQGTTIRDPDAAAAAKLVANIDAEAPTSSSSSTHHLEPGMYLAAGLQVRITGLKSRPELNDVEGILVAQVEDKWRIVLAETGVEKMIKAKNLVVVLEPGGRVEVADFPHQPDLNGRRGTLFAYTKDLWNRWQVMLDGAPEERLLAAKYLRPLPSDQADAEPERPLSAQSTMEATTASEPGGLPPTRRGRRTFSQAMTTRFGEAEPAGSSVVVEEARVEPAPAAPASHVNDDAWFDVASGDQGRHDPTSSISRDAFRTPPPCEELGVGSRVQLVGLKNSGAVGTLVQFFADGQGGRWKVQLDPGQAMKGFAQLKPCYLQRLPDDIGG